MFQKEFAERMIAQPGSSILFYPRVLISYCIQSLVSLILFDSPNLLLFASC